MKIKNLSLKLEKIGTSEEWFLVVNLEDSQERGWLIGQKEKVEKIINDLRKL